MVRCKKKRLRYLSLKRSKICHAHTNLLFRDFYTHSILFLWFKMAPNSSNSLPFNEAKLTPLQIASMQKLGFSFEFRYYFYNLYKVWLDAWITCLLLWTLGQILAERAITWWKLGQDWFDDVSLPWFCCPLTLKVEYRWNCFSSR